VSGAGVGVVVGSVAKIGARIGAGCLGIVVCSTAMAAAVVSTLTGGLLGSLATPSASALSDIPPAMLMLHQPAAGALGPVQFLPATFAQYDLPVPPGGQAPTHTVQRLRRRLHSSPTPVRERRPAR
jgi:hypothetical protein